ncbi:MATE family efflux transporter [uncultured Gemmiger sp.]|uniref:MATE family efflux transporter n=1 Tax=uncultured Gemmiger sp. TaxID=1623490 RepID=UPI0025EA1A7D|nr:MATE family efflux transporter [uncultured Gemmiger sp.]
MSSASKTLTEGPLAKQILLVSLPLALSNLLQVLFNMSDVAVVGRFAGSIALGAVGSTSTFVTLFTGFLIGLSNGINVLVARYYGAKHPKDVDKTVHSGLLVSLVAGVALLLVGLFGSPAMLRLLNTKADLMDGAVLYLRIYFLGMPALALYNFGNAVFSAMGETKKPLAYLSIAGVLNIALNLLFVIVFQLSVAGVALASTIAQCVSAALILRALTKVQDCYALNFAKIGLDASITRRILLLGVPAGLQNAVFAIANLFIQAGVNSFDTLMVKGNSAAANADAVIYDAMAAFYMACASFMSQNFGAGKLDRVKKSYFISLAYSFGLGLVLGGGLLLFGRQFLSLFTTEAAVVDAGMKRVQVMALAYCISAFMDCTIAASRGLGKTVGPTVIVIMGSCVFRVIWVYTIFARIHTIPALYLLYPCSWAITAAAEIVYFVSAYRHSVQIFEQNKIAEELAVKT